jgi:hypothetical protein
MSEITNPESIQFIVNPAREADKGLDADVVMGVIAKGATPLLHHDYDMDRTYALRRDTLSAAAVEGIYTFYQHFYTGIKTAEDQSELEAHMLMRAIHFGKTALQPQTPGLTNLHLLRHRQPTLDAGHTYTLSNQDASGYQTIVGLNGTRDNLAVLGENQVLAITDFRALRAAIGTTLTHETFPAPTDSDT